MSHLINLPGMIHHNPTYKDKFTDVHRSLLHQFKDQLINNPNKRADYALAAALISGSIDKQTVACGLLRLIGARALKVNEGRSRLTTSTLPQVGGEDMDEIAFFLASSLRNDDAMRMLGMNPKSIRRMQLSDSRLPDFYMSVASPKMLRTAASRSLTLLKVWGTRNFMLAHDETAFASGC
jgi:hypothetical protein